MTKSVEGSIVISAKYDQVYECYYVQECPVKSAYSLRDVILNEPVVQSNYSAYIICKKEDAEECAVKLKEAIRKNLAARMLELNKMIQAIGG